MLGCDKTITLIHIAYDGQADADVTTETVFTGVSWYGQNRAAVDSAGLHNARVYKCRIPAAVQGDAALPVPGDVICCGTVRATVLDVHDNRGRANGHIYVEAN